MNSSLDHFQASDFESVFERHGSTSWGFKVNIN